MALLLAFFLCACGRSETPNLASFAKCYGKISEKELAFSQIFGSETESGNEYSFTAFQDENESKKIFVKLFADKDKKLYECRILIARRDENGAISLGKDDEEHFFDACLYSLCSFSRMNEEEGRALLSSLGMSEEHSFFESGERNAESKEYYLTLLSTDPVHELLIYNTYLKKVEETQKPESRPQFDNTTKIRTETVPHK